MKILGLRNQEFTKSLDSKLAPLQSPESRSQKSGELGQRNKVTDLGQRSRVESPVESLPFPFPMLIDEYHGRTCKGSSTVLCTNLIKQ